MNERWTTGRAMPAMTLAMAFFLSVPARPSAGLSAAEGSAAAAQDSQQERQPPARGEGDADAPTESPSSARRNTPSHQRWVDRTAPDDEHRLLESLSGTWKTSFYPGGYRAGRAARSTARQVNEWIMNGRFLRMEYQSKTRAGEPYVAVTIMGYSRAKKRFESAGFDNIDTSLSYATGELGESGKTITLSGTAPDPERAGEVVETREVIAIESADRHIVTRYDVQPDGSRKERFAVVYTREA